MGRFMVCSGFLGAGKTTLMAALARYLSAQGRHTVMISNDLGGRGLCDYRFSRAAGVPSSELTGECICFQTENLVDRLRRHFDTDKASLVMSDIPGFGVGAPDHVYHTLSRSYPGEFTLAPFAAVTCPAVLSALMGEDSPLTPLLPILRAQLEEAELIVLNKCDLTGEEERSRLLQWLTAAFPGRTVFCVSALRGDGIPELSEYIMTHDTSLLPPAEADDALSDAIGTISEYNSQYYARVCCDTFDPDAYLTALAARIGSGIAKEGYEIPHLKLFAPGEDGGFSKADLLCAAEEPILAHALGHPVTDLPVVINTSAACPSAALRRIIDSAVEEVSRAFRLSVTFFYEECFGCADQGRI